MGLDRLARGIRASGLRRLSMGCGDRQVIRTSAHDLHPMGLARQPLPQQNSVNRIIIAGARGFFGSAVVRILRAEGYAPLAASQRPGGDLRLDVEDSAPFAV